ncbi:MAG: TonB-dependent receptor [Cytophagaceae bacterium]|jgi:outer membrane receptor for ferrienterochelin and colicin|nr:TonB-dependent receptor [Cytophagaceae bacterium]
MRILILTLFICSSVAIQAQNEGTILGTVKDKFTGIALRAIKVEVENTSILTYTDSSGSFKLKVPVGSYNVKASDSAYKAQTLFNINVTSGNASILNFELEEAATMLKEVVVKSKKIKTAAVGDVITPLSVQSLTTEEIRSNPGGNFDISRVVQVLPGVAGTSGVGGFRNDIIIRGGAPNENVYYLDGIEIPVLNHFQTQGSAGGPVGLLNVSFIEDVKLSSSAFDAKYDNALASVFQFKQRDGNPERISGNVRLSSTELATTVEGPLSKRTTFLSSVRRSYLQFLFSAIDLPIRPNYWDFQVKVTHKINKKMSISFIGLGAIDEFSFAVPREASADKEYILRSQPSINQWNYTGGISIKRSIPNGNWRLSVSRNAFDNSVDRFEGKQEDNEAFRLLKIRSNETENKLRWELNKNKNGWRYSAGAVAQLVQFDNAINSKIRKELFDTLGNQIQPAVQLAYSTNLNLWRYGAFAQVSRFIFNSKLGVTVGLRSDMNSFTTAGMNPLNTLSPRMSLTLPLTESWTWNASVGNYFKLPIYTSLGFKNSEGEFSNKNMKYIRATHYVTGVEFLPRKDLRFTLEGFYKDYGNYPVSVRDGISLANQGGEFGAIGNEQVRSNGKGRAYGLEFYVQQKLIKSIFAVFSYTWVRSEFSGSDGKLLPSAWDNRHLISGLLGRKFKRGWEIGLKYRFAGGAPYTPFNELASRQNYLSLGTGILDVTQLNSLRLGSFNQFDFRIDKKWNFKRWTMDLYLDVTNALVFKNPAYPQYTFQRNEANTDFATVDGKPVNPDGSNAIPLLLVNDDPIPVPTIGFIIEF